jgi:hypothetical protein
VGFAKADFCGADGDGGNGVAGAEADSFFSVQPQLQPHLGQTHSMVHFHTGVSTVYGTLTSLWTSLIRQLHLPLSQSPLPQPCWPQLPFSQPPAQHFNQQGQWSGMQITSHLQE